MGAPDPHRDGNIALPAAIARVGGLAGALAIGAILSSCAAAQEAPGAGAQAGCPRIEVVPDLARLAVTRGTTAAANVVAIASFQGTRSACAIEGDTVRVALDVALAARAGPAGAGLASVPVSYFVAVVGPGEVVLGKQLFRVTLPFDGRSVSDALEPVLPIVGAADASRYRLLIGFQMTDAQRRANPALLAATPR
jgi:hypothetical protein